MCIISLLLNLCTSHSELGCDNDNDLLAFSDLGASRVILKKVPVMTIEKGKKMEFLLELTH